jgi:hypothetical protein
MYLEELRKEPHWGGSKSNLIDIFNYGKYKVEVKETASGKLLYSRTYTTLFSEWQTTAEAKKVQKSYPEAVIVPFPKIPVSISFFARDTMQNWVEKLSFDVNPEEDFISPELPAAYETYDIIINGDAAEKVDIVFIPEGYTKAEMKRFQKEAGKFAQYLFNAEPYKANKHHFNVRAVLAPSEESGTDIPGKNIWKKTILNSSFYTFGVERYLMVDDYQKVRDVAANVPYDQIYVLVNTSKYGGGAIYNFYSVCVNENPSAEYVAQHEFGHGFANLGDEYYTSYTAYEDFYKLDVEPLEPNLTTLVDFENKWKDMIDENTPVPTPDTDEYANSVGVFEGGGYVAKGVYRPMIDCTMKTLTTDNFCPVCKRAIIHMIEFYTEENEYNLP